MMGKKFIKATMKRSILPITACLLSAYSFTASADGYCNAAKLYATNIRESCSQFGTNGMATLYQSSDFIHGLMPIGPSTRPNRDPRMSIHVRTTDPS